MAILDWLVSKCYCIDRQSFSAYPSGLDLSCHLPRLAWFLRVFFPPDHDSTVPVRPAFSYLVPFSVRRFGSPSLAPVVALLLVLPSPSPVSPLTVAPRRSADLLHQIERINGTATRRFRCQVSTKWVLALAETGRGCAGERKSARRRRQLPGRQRWRSTRRNSQKLS